ncbi:uncharacterized protein LOC114312445 [Camellia sinensis]|uniref:uncharacterized protein LOC114312445 n=1 Tax=Camellia sinensis TaxID=4442 RepID=UPI0010365866|nr:uncharacterized protein LOC114312445 [Camellia sinensis]
MTESTMGYMLVQESEEKVEKAIYYLNKKMLEYETWRAIVEFLVNHLINGEEDREYEFPDEAILQLEKDTCKLYFDGTANQYGYGIRVFLIAPDDSHIPLAFKLRFKVSNNQAKYKVYIAGLEAALELGAIRLDVIRDSNLVVSQANGDWKVKEKKMKVYHQTLDVIILRFERLTLTHLVRENNRFADALATLASMVDIPIGVRMRPIMIEKRYTRHTR